MDKNFSCIYCVGDFFFGNLHCSNDIFFERINFCEK